MAGMTALEQAVRNAVALHQKGDLDAARKAYEAILIKHPKDPNALMNLSSLHQQLGEFEQAERMLKRLVVAHPTLPQPYFAYGNLMLTMGNDAEALAKYDRSLSIAPRQADVYYNRGIVLDRMKRFAEALGSFDQALSIDPAHAKAYCNRVSTLNYLARYEEVLAGLEHPFARQATDQAWFYLTRAIALQELGQLDGALEAYNQSLLADPDRAETLSHRANAYNHQHRYEKALPDIERAMALGAKSSFAHNVRAVALNRLGRYDEAAQHYEWALKLEPGMESVYWNLAVVKLTLGDFAAGLPLYEWRWKVGPQKGSMRTLPMPLWLGKESLDGKTILIHPEQGLGDFIQCARYVPLLLQRGANVVLATPPTLLTLFFQNFASEKVNVVSIEQPLPDADFHTPIMSLPLALDLTLETLPAEIPYIKASPEKIAEWQNILGLKTKPRVGLVWSGRPQHVYDNKRSIALEMLHPLLQQNAEFHSLQIEVRKDDIEHLPALKTHTEKLRDFTDTAALIDAMDFVITVDTSVAHLAGAMGKKTWILLPYVPDYRWLLERTDSPLYPSAILFRQAKPDDWAGVISRVAQELAHVAA